MSEVAILKVRQRQPLAAVAASLLLIAASLLLPERDELGRPLPLSMLLGGAFGFLLQRSRFCFYCVARDALDGRDVRGLLGIIAALAVGLIGYHAVFGAWLPVPSFGRLPPDAHIGPVSWVLAVGAFAFGIGMALSGSCISAHLYRLGEGSGASLFALGGTVIGFGIGFLSWNFLYLTAIQDAPILWLPHWLGYGGSLALQLAVLAAAALWLLHRSWPVTAPAQSLVEALLLRRWPPYVGGILIGALATIAYFRVGPLGVTAELGSLARTAASHAGFLPVRLEGLDGLAGCATAVKNALLSRNGVFVGGLILGSLSSALAAGDFRPSLPDLKTALRSFAGGIVMGWGAMIALGCTVGVLLSGIMAGAVSGWLFAIACGTGLWLEWRLRRVRRR